MHVHNAIKRSLDAGHYHYHIQWKTVAHAMKLNHCRNRTGLHRILSNATVTTFIGIMTVFEMH